VPGRLVRGAPRRHRRVLAHDRRNGRVRRPGAAAAVPMWRNSCSPR